MNNKNFSRGQKRQQFLKIHKQIPLKVTKIDMSNYEQQAKEFYQSDEFNSILSMVKLSNGQIVSEVF